MTIRCSTALRDDRGSTAGELKATLPYAKRMLAAVKSSDGRLQRFPGGDMAGTDDLASQYQQLLLRAVGNVNGPPWIVVTVPSGDQELVDAFTTAATCQRLSADSSPSASPTS